MLQLGVKYIAVVVLQKLYFRPVWEALGTEARQPPAGAVAGRKPLSDMLAYPSDCGGGDVGGRAPGPVSGGSG